MQLKSYTLATSFITLACSQIFAQAAPTPVPKAAYIRFWDMLPASSGTFQLRKSGKPGDLLATASAYRYSSYVDLPLGQYQLSIVKSGSDAPLKNLVANLKADTYFTIILAPEGAGFKVEFIDDTLDPKATSGTITIRNYFPGASVSFSAGTQVIANGLTYGNSYVARGLTPTKMALTIEARLPSGLPAQSGVDLDFTASKNATLLVIPDSYGRFRPRVVADGRNL
jgi:hypothetical protein